MCPYSIVYLCWGLNGDDKWEKNISCVFEEHQKMRIRDLIGIAPPIRRKSHQVDGKKSPPVGFAERYDPDQETTPEKIRDDVERAVAQTHKPMSDELIYAMYGDEAGDLEIARQRLELRRLAVEVRAAEADIEATLAAAAKDRAEAERDRRREL